MNSFYSSVQVAKKSPVELIVDYDWFKFGTEVDTKF